MFDWSLPRHCPSFLSSRQARFAVPKFFAGDLLRRGPPPAAGGRGWAGQAWPSLFVAPTAGSRCALHTDAWGTAFWQLLMHGRKRWLVFAPDDAAHLFPDYHANSFAAADPLAGGTGTQRRRPPCPTECEVGPGDIIFVPAGAPHVVENVEPSVALAYNYVDGVNLDRALGELRQTVGDDGGTGDHGSRRAGASTQTQSEMGGLAVARDLLLTLNAAASRLANRNGSATSAAVE